MHKLEIIPSDVPPPLPLARERWLRAVPEVEQTDRLAAPVLVRCASCEYTATFHRSAACPMCGTVAAAFR